MIEFHEPTLQAIVKVLVDEGPISVQMDGAAHVATLATFIDLMQSPAGFGETAEEAVTDLLRQVTA